MVNVSTSALSFKSSGTPPTFLSVADVRHRTGPPYLRGRPRQETHPIPLILSALYLPTDRQQGQKGLLQQIVCDYVFWPLVGRASPHDLFRRAGTLALLREIPHSPTRATEVSHTQEARPPRRRLKTVAIPSGSWYKSATERPEGLCSNPYRMSANEESSRCSRHYAPSGNPSPSY